MNEAYYRLIRNCIPVQSVQTDAFVIHTLDLDKARELVEVHNDIGGWRAGKNTEDTILPTVNYEIVENAHVEIQTGK